MKKSIIGLIIGLCLSGVAQAYRVAKPIRITGFDQNNLVAVNENFERLWDITNGRYNLSVENTIPTKSATEGDMKGYVSGATKRLYVYMGGAWVYFTPDG